MAISATYYLNGPTLGSSTTIFSNSSLSTIAPDGFYSDGVTSREQVSGVLLPAVTCSCISYNCISGNCIDPGDGSGIYSTLEACQAQCTPSATLNWSFTETSSISTFDLLINGDIVESRSATSNGSYTVYEGDTISVDINTTGCSGLDNFANAYCVGIITESACNTGVTSLSSSDYTVVSGNLGTIINLSSYAICDGACV